MVGDGKSLDVRRSLCLARDVGMDQPACGDSR